MNLLESTKSANFPLKLYFLHANEDFIKVQKISLQPTVFKNPWLMDRTSVFYEPWWSLAYNNLWGTNANFHLQY